MKLKRKLTVTAYEVAEYSWLNSEDTSTLEGLKNELVKALHKFKGVTQIISVVDYNAEASGDYTLLHISQENHPKGERSILTAAGETKIFEKREELIKQFDELLSAVCRRNDLIPLDTQELNALLEEKLSRKLTLVPPGEDSYWGARRELLEELLALLKWQREDKPHSLFTKEGVSYDLQEVFTLDVTLLEEMMPLKSYKKVFTTAIEEFQRNVTEVVSEAVDVFTSESSTVCLIKLQAHKRKTSEPFLLTMVKPRRGEKADEDSPGVVNLPAFDLKNRYQETMEAVLVERLMEVGLIAPSEHQPLSGMLALKMKELTGENERDLAQRELIEEVQELLSEEE